MSYFKAAFSGHTQWAQLTAPRKDRGLSFPKRHPLPMLITLKTCCKSLFCPCRETAELDMIRAGTGRSQVSVSLNDSPKAHRVHNCRGTGTHVQRPPGPRPRLSRLFCLWGPPRSPNGHRPCGRGPTPEEPPAHPLPWPGATSSALHLTVITPALLGPGDQPRLPQQCLSWLRGDGHLRQARLGTFIACLVVHNCVSTGTAGVCPTGRSPPSTRPAPAPRGHRWSTQNEHTNELRNERQGPTKNFPECQAGDNVTRWINSPSISDFTPIA